MPSIEEQLLLRAQFQALEDDLLLVNQRHVYARTARGVFSWLLSGASDVEPEEVDAAGFQPIEDMIIAQGWDNNVVATQRGTFAWTPAG